MIYCSIIRLNTERPDWPVIGIEGCVGTYLFRPSFYPFPGVLVAYPSSYLELSWPGLQSFPCCGLVAGAEHDDMRSLDMMLSVETGIVSSRMF